MKSIKYTMMTDINHSTEEEQDIKQVFDNYEIQCSDDVFEANLAIAQKYAYNGEVTVEDDGQPEPSAEPTQLDRVEAQATYTAMMTDTLLEG